MRPLRHSLLRRAQVWWVGSAFAMFCGLFAPAAHATPICRWVNEAGGTEFASVVPERYKGVATCVESQAFELSGEQRRAADQAVAEEKGRLSRAASKPPTPEASSLARKPKPAPSPATKRPTEAVSEATDCPTWWRIYDESVACFGPYRTARGATKKEGFDRCNVILSPEARCGARSQ